MYIGEITAYPESNEIPYRLNKYFGKQQSRNKPMPEQFHSRYGLWFRFGGSHFFRRIIRKPKHHQPEIAECSENDKCPLTAIAGGHYRYEWWHYDGAERRAAVENS